MTRSRFFLCLVFSLCVLCASAVNPAAANPPTASYVFPAGGQRGTAVPVRVGGLFLHDKCQWDITGPGVTASPELVREKRVWFEGPVLPLPESQQQEDYPADMRGAVTLAKDAKPGPARVRVFTSQGGASGPLFVVGELPEVVEKEIDGDAIPETIALPVTANGRVFPREDIDLWEFGAEAGKTVTAFAHGKAINSPTVPQLDVLDAMGNVVAEQSRYPVPGADASVKFTPKVAGKYRVRITDARTLGGPGYVYRLTVTTANVPDFDFPLKVPADGLKDVAEAGAAAAAPCALNGQVAGGGAASQWKLELKKGGRYTFDLHARKFGSPLCGVVTVSDATGKPLAKAEATETADPAALAFSPPADGTYLVTVAEKFRGRGGPNFVYRLRVLDAAAPPPGPPGFVLSVPSDVFTIQRGSSLSVKVTATRTGGFVGAILITPTGLPKGVTAERVAIASSVDSTDLVIKAAPDAEIAVGTLRLEGRGVGGVTGRVTGEPARGPGPGSGDVKLAVAFPTPFKFLDQYVMTAAPRGETYYRKYKIDRGTFVGPVTVQLADKQARHLQGVTGPVLVLKPDESEFEYPAFLPPWMELGRTCRVCVMATATVRDPADGREHVVSFSSTEQNQQMIVVVAPGRLDLAVERTSIRAEAGGEVRVPVKVSRSKSLTGAAKVEAVIPEHWKGVTAAPLVIPADGEAGELVLRFAADCGPFNAPLVLRATVETPTTPVTAEAKVEVVK